MPGSKLNLLFLLVNAVSAVHHQLTVHNGSEVELRCPPAEAFIRTNMAPDFESPQLVRSLEWQKDGTTVARFKSRNGWAGDVWNENRFELVKPFYALRLSPVRTDDTGVFSCHFETDPLFPAAEINARTQLSVIVRPVPPSAPGIKASSPSSATLSWTHATAHAHRPILRYSVVVRSVADGARFVIAAPSNATTVIVENLSRIPALRSFTFYVASFSEYAFSVRGENAAGSGEFGPETSFTTQGIPPSQPPSARVGNATARCLRLSIDGPLPATTQHLRLTLGFHNGTIARDMRLEKSVRQHEICQLSPYTRYNLSLTSVSPHGSSPPYWADFRTDEDVPSGPPRDVRVEGVFGRPSLTVSWSPPANPNGQLTTYHIYQRPAGTDAWKTDLLKIKGREDKQRYRIEIKGLQPTTRYTIRVSASTARGESEKSAEKGATTDVSAPAAPKIETIVWECRDMAVFSWADGPRNSIYTVEVDAEGKAFTFNTTHTKIDIPRLKKVQEYSVRLRVLVRSVVTPSQYVEGEWGQHERFSLQDDCSIHSTLCPSTGRFRCLPLTQMTPIPSQPIQPVLAFSAVFVFLVVLLLIVFLFKNFHRCIGADRFHKKREKSVYIEELSPLVYDSIGCEEIPVEIFYGYCEDLGRDDGAKYRAQFEQVERNSAEYCASGDSLLKNSEKNRYNNIGAIDSSRVRLTGGNTNGDYINANYVDSCEKRNVYIATQAPLPSTYGDFYAMLWQERTNVVLMIANLEENGLKKCDQYWPAACHTTETYGSFQVTLISQTTCAHFIQRTLSVKISKCVPQTERRIHQLQFLGWPDHGAPSSPFPLLSYLHAAAHLHATGPIVVHCSAGVGRSGSFLLIDSMRRRLLGSRSLNLMGHLMHIRKQREQLVQTLEQYIFCHEAVRQLIRHGITRIQSSLFTKYVRYLAEGTVNGRSRMMMQYEDLCKCPHTPDCQPEKQYLILPGFHRLDEFLVGGWQQEGPELWRAVWENSVHTVLLLGDNSEFWGQSSEVGELCLTRDGETVVISDGEQQLRVRLLCTAKSEFDADTWGRIESVQTERSEEHDRPLMIISPDGDDPAPEVNALADVRAFQFCALTALACQFEQQGCLDVVQLLSAYTEIQCGLWRTPREIEFIYERALQLIMMANA
ncbi:unnamed protein product, partial [Mesorhabditis spiculigera]